MTMEEYRKKLTFRQRLAICMCLAAPSSTWLIRSLAGEVTEYARGLLAGVLVSGILIGAFVAARMTVLLKNEDKLREQYIKATDERNQAISRETSRAACLILLVALYLGIIVSAFFSITVSLTLFCVLQVFALAVFGSFFYYKGKM
ncbi:MAG: hypothetical protein IKN55_13085 [Oscillospiraceae bacterium]|nr:hypothetical protein [Oscillospiraceae bacterium]